MSAPGIEERRHHMGGRVAARGAGPTGSLFETLWAAYESAIDPCVYGLATDAVELAAFGHGQAVT
jgi:hypothetical protein